MSTSSMRDSSRSVVSSTATLPGRGYRTLWRWHFYAGLFVMPFLVILAITGTVYCFQPQIEPLLYPHRLIVTPQSTPRLTEDALLAKARAALPPGSTAVAARIATAPDRSAEFVFRVPHGGKESVYLNPYDGTVLGTLSVERRFMQVDRMIHRKLLLGKPGELLMELVACWTLVMIATGIALWWPRAGATLRGALLPRLSLPGRARWKSLHAALGIWLAVGAVAFVLTGLPWTGSWGKQLKSLATSVNLGSPPGAWGGSTLHSTRPGATAMPATQHASSDMDSMPGMTMDDLPLSNVPWATGAVPVPHSPDAPAAAKDAEPVAAGTAWPLARVVESLRALGLTGGYDIALPTSPDGVFAVSYFPSDPQQERTLYLDQYSGAVLKDIRYRDYGAVSKAVSYGTSLHMGRYFGLANQIVCTVLSLGLATMAVTGFAMWWMRRPSRVQRTQGVLAAPARERAAPPMRGWQAGLVLLGIVFPLMGATLVVVWLADRLVFGRTPDPIAS
ncbi:PepSY-associated TM helix domain-containing protein [Paraburkholderia sp.]|uniref:PepSY-associated TM helix domain-containing protein n=1 Tax=Paraburkholderia sp. TaxID=1926495 RepID=UPI003D700A7A